MRGGELRVSGLDEYLLIANIGRSAFEDFRGQGGAFCLLGFV